MSISALYEEMILDHAKNPFHKEKLAQCNCEAEGNNPLCGDQIFLQLWIETDHIKNAGFTGEGCAISTASASLMNQAIQGKSIAEVQLLAENFIASLTEEKTVETDLGKLAVLEGVKEYPMRVKCATLAWHALDQAIAQSKQGIHSSKTTISED